MPWQAELMLRVVVGIVYNTEKKILIAKRPLNKHLGGYWEFPGGKIEANETIFDALKRELKEEVGLELLAAKSLTQIKFTYSEKTVLLDVLELTDYSGEAQGLEGQAIRWVSLQELNAYQFPEANQEIFQHLHQ